MKEFTRLKAASASRIHVLSAEPKGRPEGERDGNRVAEGCEGSILAAEAGVNLLHGLDPGFRLRLRFGLRLGIKGGKKK